MTSALRGGAQLPPPPALSNVVRIVPLGGDAQSTVNVSPGAWGAGAGGLGSLRQAYAVEAGGIAKNPIAQRSGAGQFRVLRRRLGDFSPFRLFPLLSCSEAARPGGAVGNRSSGREAARLREDPMPGPRPTPIPLKLLRGNPGKRPIRRGFEPSQPPLPPNPPGIFGRRRP